jgi:hypothetical protein
MLSENRLEDFEEARVFREGIGSRWESSGCANYKMWGVGGYER